MTGPRLLASITLAVIAMVATIVLTSDGGTVETASTVIRWTARTSFVAFALAFAARPAMQLARNSLTKFLLAERKWIGLGYASSHAAHLAGIVVLASQDLDGFVSSQSVGTMTGTFTFLLLFAMAFTSIEAIKRRMSPRTWKALHRTGMYFSWIAFTSTYGLALTKSPVYAFPVAIMLGIAGMRVVAWMRVRQRHRGVAA